MQNIEETEPYCIDSESDPQPERAQHSLSRRVLRRAAVGALAITSSCAGLAAGTYATNPDLREVTGGLIFDSGTLYPEIDVCELGSYDDYMALHPPGTDKADADKETVDQKTSSVWENSLAGLNPARIKRDYDAFFDNPIDTYTSPLSGLEYDFFAFGDHEPPTINAEAIDTAMYLPISGAFRFQSINVHN